MKLVKNLNIFPLDMLKKLQNGDFFAISDTHFGHLRCYEKFEPSRQTIANSFDGFENELVNRWNETVSEIDIVLVIGDFCINKTNNEKTLLNIQKFSSQLNGRKVLIKGNHDINDNDIYFKSGFEVVIDQPIDIHNLSLTIKYQLNPQLRNPGSIVLDILGKRTFISHFGHFLKDTKGDKYATTLDFFSKRYKEFNCEQLLHGHSHGNSESGVNVFNASVEVNDFRPVHYSKIKKIMNNN